MAVSLESGMPAATRYQIAGSITLTSYVSYRSAFAYYGYANQVSYEMNVSSDTAFRNFEYEGITYMYISSRLPEGMPAGQSRMMYNGRWELMVPENLFHMGGNQEES